MTTGQVARVVMDVRHVRNDETVTCVNKEHAIEPWAKFVVAVDLPRPGPRWPVTLYLCQPCLKEFLYLSDNLKVI